MDIKQLCRILRSPIDKIEHQKNKIFGLIPESLCMYGFDQRNPAHQYDLWTHSLKTVEGICDTDDDMLLLVAFLHDIGKPSSMCAGKKPWDGYCHYWGHPKRSYEIVCGMTRRFVASGQMTKDEAFLLSYYVFYHDMHPTSMRIKHLRMHIPHITLKQFKNLMLLQIADANAHIQIPEIVESTKLCRLWSGSYADEMMDQIIAEEMQKICKNKA